MNEETRLAILESRKLLDACVLAVSAAKANVAHSQKVLREAQEALRVVKLSEERLTGPDRSTE